MKHVSTPAILRMAAALTLLLGAFGYFKLTNTSITSSQRADQIEAIAKEQFETHRGLTPCTHHTPEMKLTLSTARTRLRQLGESEPQILIIILPSFSGATVVNLSKDNVHSYRFNGQAGYLMPEEQFAATPQRTSKFQPTASTYHEITTTVSRQIRYAMSTTEFGKDGSTYIFAYGDDQCAYTWSPDPPSRAASTAALADELSSPQPSNSELLSIVRSIDQSYVRH